MYRKSNPKHREMNVIKLVQRAAFTKYCMNVLRTLSTCRLYCLDNHFRYSRSSAKFRKMCLLYMLSAILCVTFLFHQRSYGTHISKGEPSRGRQFGHTHTQTGHTPNGIVKWNSTARHLNPLLYHRHIESCAMC